MTPEQWETLQKCAAGEELPTLPVALIVDSPWIPGFLGISTLDYLTIPEVWLKANLAVEQAFPGRDLRAGLLERDGNGRGTQRLWLQGQLVSGQDARGPLLGVGNRPTQPA